MILVRNVAMRGGEQLTSHRKEGDHSNASYWFGRAGEPVCPEPLEPQWEKHSPGVAWIEQACS
jgi:hypothetical protein